MPSRRGRDSALTDIAAQTPHAVLGVSIGAATGWAAAAGGPRAQYAAESAAARRAQTGGGCWW